MLLLILIDNSFLELLLYDFILDEFLFDLVEIHVVLDLYLSLSQRLDLISLLPQ